MASLASPWRRQRPAGQALSRSSFKARDGLVLEHLLLLKQINYGIPVACGYIHRGPGERPTGSGHWLIVVGHAPTHVVVHSAMPQGRVGPWRWIQLL
jgi:hypothetical protein